jgi:hypothetical protein
MENSGYRLIFIAAIILVIYGCRTRSFDSEKELWVYLKQQDNGYHFQKTFNDVDYVLTYKPTDLLVEQELNDTYTLKEISTLRKKYKDYLYFNLSISSKGQELLNHKAGNQLEFKTLASELSFKMAENIHLISEKRDTIILLDYSYPRLYGMSKSTDMLLVYPRDSSFLEQDYLLLTIEDFGFKTGEVSFKIETQKIREQPKLSFKDNLISFGNSTFIEEKRNTTNEPNKRI